MSIPLIVVGAAGAALLFAGSKEKSAQPLPTQNATPTTQSTGGEAGGAQAPSHAGSEATNSVSDLPDRTLPELSGGGALSLGGKPNPSFGGATASGDVGSGSTGQEFGSDPWADAAADASPTTTVDPHKVKTGSDALSAVTKIGEVTAKAAAQSFATAANALGAIW